MNKNVEIFGKEIKGEEIYRFLEKHYKGYDLFDSWYYQMKRFIESKNINFNNYFYSESYSDKIYFGYINGEKKKKFEFKSKTLTLFDEFFKEKEIKLYKL